MANNGNLAFKNDVYTGDEYASFETIMDVSLTQGSSYVIQVQGDGVNGVMFCEASSKPTEGGFFWNTTEPFTYTKGTTSLWILVQNGKKVSINVADK